MNYTIDSRCRNVMLALTKSTDYITIEALSQELGQSRRNTQYDLYKLNGIFDLIDIPHIQSRRNKGVRLLPEHLEWWQGLLRKGGNCFNYVYTQEERVAFLICKTVLRGGGMWTIERFSEALAVNRSTVIWDMKLARERLADYKVGLDFSGQGGCSANGGELARRSVFMYYLSLLYPLIRDGILSDFTGEPYRTSLEKLRQIESELSIHFQEGTLDKIAILCPHLNSGDAGFQIDNAEEIVKTREYACVKKYYPHLPECEQLYLSVQLLGGRIRDIYAVPSGDLSVYRAHALELIRCFENLVNMEIENKDQLTYNLARHLSRAFYRYKYGLIDSCVLESEITTKSKELYELVRMAVQEFSRKIGYPINNSEVAFLTIHFGAHFRRNSFNTGKVRVLLVTAEEDEAAALAEQIEHEFPMLHLTGAIPSSQLMNQEKNYDIVISTQLLKYNGLYVYVSRQLDNRDKQKIIELYVNFRTLNEESIGRDLFDRIKAYIPREYQGRVQEEIHRCFFGPVPNLMQLLDRESVQYTDQIANWRDAIAQAAMPLVENDSILPGYIDDLILYAELYGSFAYLGNRAYLVHAKDNGNIRRSGVSLLVVHDGVKFREGRAVHVLIVVASVNKNEHLKVLQEAVKLCDSEEKVEAMLKCRSGGEVYNAIKKIIN